MEKSKFGISLTLMACIAFSFGILRQAQPVLLVAGFALITEKNEWLSRQVIQAVLLSLVYYLAVLVSDGVFGGMARFFGFFEIYGASTVMTKINGVIGGTLYIVFLVFSLMAILKVLKGKDADLPYLSKLIGGNFASGLSPTSEQVVEAYDPVAGEDVSGLCPSCSAQLDEGASFCTKCGSQVSIK